MLVFVVDQFGFINKGIEVFVIFLYEGDFEFVSRGIFCYYFLMQCEGFVYLFWYLVGYGRCFVDYFFVGKIGDFVECWIDVNDFVVQVVGLYVDCQ